MVKREGEVLVPGQAETGSEKAMAGFDLLSMFLKNNSPCSLNFNTRGSRLHL
jgi:hypothetical protein